jgi:molecular chaperone HtpG
MTEQKTFQIQLPGLIKLLAQHLYAEPDVFLREMIQNAHDSITRRAELVARSNGSEPPAPRIVVTVERSEGVIRIEDNGSGLTTSEIDLYLSTIGRSGTGELRESILRADRSRTVELIGQFGIGLLSAFIVADRVTVLTRADGEDALLWESGGGETYTVAPGERARVGTTVSLYLRNEHGHYLNRERLRSIIRTYADFIGMPIYLDQDIEPANAVTAPWHRRYHSDTERDRAYVDFWDRKFDAEQALYVFPVDELVEWNDPTDPDGRGTGRVRGVLAVTDRHIPDVNVRGTVDLYVSRMFINAGNRDILPPWARFLQGVVECDALTPNAARDNVVRNAALSAVQNALGGLVVRELTDLSRHHRRRFVEIMRWHAYHVLAMAVQHQHEDFFRAVADLMPLTSDQGPMTVAEYLQTAPERTDGAKIIYYIAERGSANQFFMLAGAKSIRVFDCAEPFAEEFLERYARTWPDRVHLSRLDVAGSDTIFEPLAAEEAPGYHELAAAYLRLFPDMRCIAKVSRFRPTEMPAVLTETRRGQNRRELDKIITDVVLPDYIRRVVGTYVNAVREPMTLHLNAENPTIQKLATRATLNDDVSRHALLSLYNNALMLLARALTVEDVQAMFVQYNQVIELMLSLAEDRTKFERRLNARQTELDELRNTETSLTVLDPYISCFVAMPFRDPRATAIFEALREVLEDAPYHWRVVRADDEIERAGLWDNLKSRMLRAHCYVAILTEPVNPNVMIEVGRMEALERPMLLLRDAAAAEPPSDLAGHLYEAVTATGADLVQAVRDVIQRQTALRDLRGARYLSETILRREGLSGEASRKISSLYPSWDTFVGTDPHEISSKVGVKPAMVEAVQTALAAPHSQIRNDRQ